MKQSTFLLIVTLGIAIGLSACDPAFVARFRAAFRDEIGRSAEGQVCANNSDYAALISDCPFEGLCFSSACEAHDDCYNNCLASREECDRRFRFDMFEICSTRFELDQPGQRECLYFANIYWAAVHAEGDGFYDCDFIPTEPVPGACCRAGAPPVCEEVDSSSACGFASLFIPGLTCKDVTETFGGCPRPENDQCAERIVACPDQSAATGMGRCEATAVDDPLLANRVCSLNSQDCVFPEACLPYDGEVFRCVVHGDNRLATTDGPEPGDICGFADSGRFQADIWYEYRAPCTGTMTIQMCNGTFYDAVLAVYGNGETECTCPGEGVLPLGCNDDGCATASSPSIASVPVIADGCYVIRVGGWSLDAMETGAARGVSRLDIGVLCGEEMQNVE